ncbi:hypothetical protein BHM03_00027814 [Ensete ventricosum]|nr:hypothetical protein BHM03_00027814 [Ensete ventricosum]
MARELGLAEHSGSKTGLAKLCRSENWTGRARWLETGLAEQGGSGIGLVEQSGSKVGLPSKVAQKLDWSSWVARKLDWPSWVARKLDWPSWVGMTSSDSSSNVGVVPSPGSGGTSPGGPEASSSGMSSGPPSLVDARILRDLDVMKACHDLDMAVIEESLVAIRE